MKRTKHTTTRTAGPTPKQRLNERDLALVTGGFILNELLLRKIAVRRRQAAR